MLAGHFRRHDIITPERVAPSPLDKTLLHLSFMPVPTCSFTLRLITHILLCFCFDIFGISGKVLAIVSASALVIAFHTLVEPPGMLLVLMPVYCFRCYLFRGSLPSECFQGNSSFYTPLVTSSSLVLESMTSLLHILIGCHGALIGYQGTGVPPSGDFSHFPVLFSAERSDVFQPSSRLDAFSPAGRMQTLMFSPGWYCYFRRRFKTRAHRNLSRR